MTMPLPSDGQYGVLSSGEPWMGLQAPGWVITWGPYINARLLSRIAIVSPVGMTSSGTLILWNETTRLTVAPSPAASEYEPYRPIHIAAGTRLFLVWSSGSGTQPPHATLFTEQSIWSSS